MASLELTERFIKGLKSYNLTKEEMIGWTYCGGKGGGINSVRHKNYFKQCFPGFDFPDLKDECVCGHAIKENCYITNDLLDGELLILGNCCIKKFLPKDNAGRTCEICKKPHKNRKDNRCKQCRIKFCQDCTKEKYRNYNKCKDCLFNGICVTCKTTISKSYLQCYNCRFYK